MSAGNSEAVRDLVVIGGSAGALPALSKLLPELEPNFPAPIIVVIHLVADTIPIGIYGNFARIENSGTAFDLKIIGPPVSIKIFP